MTQKSLRHFFGIFSLALFLMSGLQAAAFAQSMNPATERLFDAINKGDLAAVQSAVAAGAQLDLENSWGLTAADMAVDKGHFEIAHFLLNSRRFMDQNSEREIQETQQSVKEPSDLVENPPLLTAPKAAPDIPPPPAPSALTGPDPFAADYVPPGATLSERARLAEEVRKQHEAERLRQEQLKRDADRAERQAEEAKKAEALRQQRKQAEEARRKEALAEQKAKEAARLQAEAEARQKAADKAAKKAAEEAANRAALEKARVEEKARIEEEARRLKQADQPTATPKAPPKPPEKQQSVEPRAEGKTSNQLPASPALETTTEATTSVRRFFDRVTNLFGSEQTPESADPASSFSLPPKPETVADAEQPRPDDALVTNDVGLSELASITDLVDEKKQERIAAEAKAEAARLAEEKTQMLAEAREAAAAKERAAKIATQKTAEEAAKEAAKKAAEKAAEEALQAKKAKELATLAKAEKAAQQAKQEAERLALARKEEQARITAEQEAKTEAEKARAALEQMKIERTKETQVASAEQPQAQSARPLTGTVNLPSAAPPKPRTIDVDDKGFFSNLMDGIGEGLGLKGDTDNDTKNKASGENQMSMVSGEKQGVAEVVRLNNAARGNENAGHGAPKAATPPGDVNEWAITEVRHGPIQNENPAKTDADQAVKEPSYLKNTTLLLGEFGELGEAIPKTAAYEGEKRNCIRKKKGTVSFCILAIDWPTSLHAAIKVSTVLYTGNKAVVRFDADRATRMHVLFPSGSYDTIKTYYQKRYGAPTESWKRTIAPMGKPRLPNPTVIWRSLDQESKLITSLEIRKFDDTRGGFPDEKRGAIMLYNAWSEAIFPQVSELELMSMKERGAPSGFLK